MKNSFKTDIVLGEKYRDEQTGYEGTATAVYFFQHACERVCLETYDPTTKKIIESTFDSPRLTSIKTGRVAKTDKTGGPARETAIRPTGGAR